MFEYVFTQMTKANTQSCNKFNSSMIFTFKNIIWGWPDKIQDIVFKSTKASNILKFGKLIEAKIIFKNYQHNLMT